MTTRDAEDPENSRSSYIAATTPDQLFTNLRNSFSEKITKDYMSCFVDSSFLKITYSFTPSSEAIFKYNSLNDWDLESEDIYFRNLVNALSENDNIILTLELLSNSVEGNIENRNYNYKITLPIIDESTYSIYEGNAFFKVNLDANNQWVITEWTDTKVSDNPTWSELKGRFHLF
ncbi:MAG: hypothetical protein H6611_05295 [Ignavibacteriales bacterium]|nr:hypothetical protein [Ignavibacteriales bacterium]MCB9210565.1 hypothetical protein [Ignavibacteriales bacterium]